MLITDAPFVKLTGKIKIIRTDLRFHSDRLISMKIFIQKYFQA